MYKTIKADMLMWIMKKFPGEILLDPEDYERFKFNTVSKLPNGYVNIVIKNKQHRLHRAVTNFEFDIVDHKNNKPWDCRKENLRDCTTAQNQYNAAAKVNNKSGYKGVTWDPKACKWRAQITIRGVKRSLGSFKTAEAASNAYEIEARFQQKEFHYKEFAN